MHVGLVVSFWFAKKWRSLVRSLPARYQCVAVLCLDLLPDVTQLQLNICLMNCRSRFSLEQSPCLQHGFIQNIWSTKRIYCRAKCKFNSLDRLIEINVVFFVFFTEFMNSVSRHSDVSLDELGVGDGTVKEDDKAVLLEGGGLQSASPKARSLSASSPIFRFLCFNSVDSSRAWLIISLFLAYVDCICLDFFWWKRHSWLKIVSRLELCKLVRSLSYI